MTIAGRELKTAASGSRPERTARAVVGDVGFDAPTDAHLVGKLELVVIDGVEIED